MDTDFQRLADCHGIDARRIVSWRSDGLHTLRALLVSADRHVPAGAGARCRVVSLRPRVVRFALPLALAGLGLALFHLALTAGWIPESIRPCQQGVPCSSIPVIWFGFVTIPLLSVLSFLLVAGLLLATTSERLQ